VLYQPFRDNVFVLLEKTDRVTAGGIHLPDTADTEHGKDMLTGHVLQAGAGGFGFCEQTEEFQYFQVDVCAGDRVLIHKHAGQDVIVGEHIKSSSAPGLPLGTEIRVVRNNEIAGVLED
jgi:co-chaperonin GroES (HSP10)